MNISELKDNIGQFVNGPITGTLTSSKNIETKTGKRMSAGKLSDDTGSVDLKSMDHDLHRHEGKTITLTGKGMKADEYNGYTNLWIGKATKIEVDGAPAVSRAAPAAAPAAPRQDQDFVPQTLAYMMGAALHSAMHDPDSDGQPKVDIIANYAVAMYEAREKAVELIREKIKAKDAQ